MIGVIANPADDLVVAEFFELFKTPWECYRDNRRYDVILCASDDLFDPPSAKCVVIFGSQSRPFDVENEIAIASRKPTRMLWHGGNRIPIYGESVTFHEDADGVPVCEESDQPVIRIRKCSGSTTVRIGYDLFSEIRLLLTAGQPEANASHPTLDLHINLLRELIVGSGAPLVEIPPVPAGYNFIACLTHDIDHPSIYNHEFDHTMFGFLYRAIVGSSLNLLRGRIKFRDLFTNWIAALKLPMVYLGLAKDFWRDFDDRYLELEAGLPSTFFVIPFKNQRGRNHRGFAPGFRAARYGARDIAKSIKKLVAAGCEVGLHGVDAWLDTSSAKAELDEIRELTGVAATGVRMHWLYYDQQSPNILDRADAAYDSTLGYNQTVGYRAGTAQAFRAIGNSQLLELPLHVMDTALFYPSYLGLSARQAKARVDRMIDTAAQFGGCLTINWHDRSLAPERLWGSFYRELIEEMKNRGAWFATAGQAATWFRERRSVAFESDGIASKAAGAIGEQLPTLQMRVHNTITTCNDRTLNPESCVETILLEGASRDGSMAAENLPTLVSPR